MNSSLDVTQMVADIRSGRGSNAVDNLFPIVYDELRLIARRILSSERPGHTLSTTALVHEAYIKLVDQTRSSWQDRAHFCGIAARAMRQILIDYARRRNAKKRGSGVAPLPLDESRLDIDTQAELLIGLDDALEKLSQFDERAARIVEARFFAGLTEEEIGAVLNVSSRTVRRDWVKAKAWLHAELYGA